MHTTIQKWGNSHGIRIPKSLLDQMGMGENEELEIVAANDEIILRKAKKHRTFEERMAGYTGDDEFCEMDTGDSVGREVF